jgi:hypothetical protein
MEIPAHGGLLLTDHTIVNPLAASRAAKTAASTLEDVARVKKEKYADDAKNMGATFTPLVCSVYGHMCMDRQASGRAALGTELDEGKFASFTRFSPIIGTKNPNEPAVLQRRCCTQANASYNLAAQ